MPLGKLQKTPLGSNSRPVSLVYALGCSIGIRSSYKLVSDSPWNIRDNSR